MFRVFGRGSVSHGGFVGGWGACRGYANCSVVYEYFVGRSKIVNVNIIVSPYVDEVIISDYVASELGVILLDFKKGLWRLADDYPRALRLSE